MTEPTDRLPETSPVRVADAVGELADSIDDADLRAQLHALAGIVRNLAVPARARELEDVYARLADAHHEGDDAGVTHALALLAELEEERVRPVDWTAASGG